MNGSELKEFTTEILDGLDMGDDIFYPLLNVAKTKLEERRTWQFLKKLNNSNTASTGSNPAGFNLPDDFAIDLKLFIEATEYFPVSFDEQHEYQNSALRYYIDFAQEKFFFTGNVGRGGTINFYYKRFTPDIEEGTSPVFPVRFHKILSYLVAAYYQAGVDADDVFARMAPENKIAAFELIDAMETWDTELALRAQNHQVGMDSGAGRGGVPLELM